MDGASAGAVAAYGFTNVTANHTIAAAFALNVYTITASAQPGVTISPSGAVPVSHGANQTFTLGADDCHEVAAIIVDGAGVDIVSQSSYTFTNVQADHSISIVASLREFPITASAGAGGTITPSGIVEVPCSSARSFAIAANPGYTIADVVVDGVSRGAQVGWTIANVREPHTIHAEFAAIPYALTLAAIGRGGVTKAPDQAAYTYGDVVTLTALPAAGWTFTGWSGDATGSANPLPVTIDAAKSITATFADTAAPAVHVIAPNGGEAVGIAQSVLLRWSAADNANVAGVDLLLSRTGAGGAYEILAAGAPNTGTYEWTATGPPTTDAWFAVIARDSLGHAAADTSDAAFTISGPTAAPAAAVAEFALAPVTPNPSRGIARLGFELPRACRVRLDVLDVQGRVMQVLLDAECVAGRQAIDWRAAAGRRPARAGVYLVRLTAGGHTILRRCALVP